MHRISRYSCFYSKKVLKIQDTDYLLVKAGKLNDAIAALEGGGHSVEIALEQAGKSEIRDGETRERGI